MVGTRQAAGRRAGRPAEHAHAPPPAAADLRCLTGVRAVASIGVVCLHCYMFWQFFLPLSVKHGLTLSNPAIRLASLGMLWVDVLLLLSAMLAAYQLLPALESNRRGAPTCKAVVLSYWRRRAARILPGYAVANLLAAVALGPSEGVSREAQAAKWIHFFWCPQNVWANLAFLQNWLGTRGCAIHFWTVALQVHFYLALPLLLWALHPRSPGFRRRLAAALAAAVAAGTAWRVWSAWRVDFMELPVADFAVDQPSQLSWANMLTATYLPTASRGAELAAGAALGLLLRSPDALGLLGRRRVLVSATTLALQAALAAVLLRRPLLFRLASEAPWPLEYARLHISLLSFGGPLAAAAVCGTLLCLVLQPDPLHAAAARLLAARFWRPLAELSFFQFLLHEQARVWVLLLLPAGLVERFVRERPAQGFAAVAAGTLAAGYACALLLHWMLGRWAGQPSELAPVKRRATA